MSTLCGRGAASDSGQGWAGGEGFKGNLGKSPILTMRVDCASRLLPPWTIGARPTLTMGERGQSPSTWKMPKPRRT
eukprot:4467528-Pyramimonas_sp.AAC.1